MDHLGKVLSESRASLHLVESLDCHDVHRDEVVAHTILLRSPEQERHNQVEMIVEDLRLKLGQEVDRLLCDLDELIWVHLLNVVRVLGLFAADLNQMKHLRQDKVHV